MGHGALEISKVIRNKRDLRHIHVKKCEQQKGRVEIHFFEDGRRVFEYF
jgi:hypothetical protein